MMMNASIKLLSQQQQKVTTRSLFAAQHQVRAFGAPPSDPNHVYVKHTVNSQQTTFKIPAEHDIAYQLPKKPIFNEKFHQWVAGKWAVDRDEVLDNTRDNKYSAYYHFRTNPL